MRLIGIQGRSSRFASPVSPWSRDGRPPGCPPGAVADDRAAIRGPIVSNGDVHAARRRDLERLPGRTGQPV